MASAQKPAGQVVEHMAARIAGLEEQVGAHAIAERSIRKVLLAAKGFENSTRSTAQLAEDVAARLTETGAEMERQRDRAAKANSDIEAITAAYFAAGFGPSPTNPAAIGAALGKARDRGDALIALGWDGTGDPRARVNEGGSTRGREALKILGWKDSVGPLAWARSRAAQIEETERENKRLSDALKTLGRGIVRQIVEVLQEQRRVLTNLTHNGAIDEFTGPDE